MAYDFKTLKAEQIKEYMEAHATTPQKKEFMKVAFPATKKKTAVLQFATDGSPIMYQEKDKNGNNKFNEDGSPKMRQKTKMVEVAGGETSKTFNLLAAKWWFAETFPEAVENVPVKQVKKPSPADMFNW